MAVLTRKAHTTGVPSYLKEHLVQHVASHPTRSTALPLMNVPRLTTDFARRSFSYSAPDIWNSLPANVLLCDCESGFKRHLKTFLFNTCFYSAWLTLSSVPLASRMALYKCNYYYYYYMNWRWLTVLCGERLLNGTGVLCVVTNNVSEVKTGILCKPTHYLLSVQITSVQRQVLIDVNVLHAANSPAQHRHCNIITTQTKNKSMSTSVQLQCSCFTQSYNKNYDGCADV